MVYFPLIPKHIICQLCNIKILHAKCRFMDVHAKAIPVGSSSLGMMGGILFYLYNKLIFSVNIDDFLKNSEISHQQVANLDSKFLEASVVSVCMLPENSQIQILNSSGSLAVLNLTDGHVLYITTGLGTVSATQGTRTEYRL